MIMFEIGKLYKCSGWLYPVRREEMEEIAVTFSESGNKIYTHLTMGPVHFIRPGEVFMIIEQDGAKIRVLHGDKEGWFDTSVDDWDASFEQVGVAG